MRQQGSMNSIPPKDTPLHIVKTRNGSALAILLIVGAGVILTLGLLAADVYYSYLPLIGVTDEWLCWILAGITTPIEVAGAYLLGSREQRKDLDKTMRWFWWGILIASFIYDIATNIGGLYDTAQHKAGGQMNALHWCFILSGASIMAFVEYLLTGLLGVFLAHVAEYQTTSKWLEAWEEGRQGPTPGAMSSPRGIMPDARWGGGPSTKTRPSPTRRSK